MTYREAVRSALRDALHRDSRVFLMGEDVGRYGGAFAVSHGLLEEFGPERIRDTPLMESTFVGAGIGTALTTDQTSRFLPLKPLALLRRLLNWLDIPARRKAFQGDGGVRLN